MPHFPHWTWEKREQREKERKKESRNKGWQELQERKNMCRRVSSSSEANGESVGLTGGFFYSHSKVLSVEEQNVS